MRAVTTLPLVPRSDTEDLGQLVCWPRQVRKERIPWSSPKRQQPTKGFHPRSDLADHSVWLSDRRIQFAGPIHPLAMLCR